MVALLAGCAGPAIAWQGLPVEDPRPPDDPELRDYKETHYRNLGRRIVARASRSAVLDTLRPGDVLFLGDHHRDIALHLEHRAVLDELVERGQPFALGLEAIGTEDARSIARFLGRAIELDELVETIELRWPDSWLSSLDVDAPHYRDLLRLARTAGAPVFALEPTPRIALDHRDQRIAASILAARAAHPDRVIVVVVGHVHLLGPDRVVERVGGTATVVGARLPNSLRPDTSTRTDRRYRRSDAGVWFPPAAR